MLESRRLTSNPQSSPRRRGKAAALACMLLLVLCAPIAGQERAAEPSKRPNVLFLFADDQRADTIGAWGNGAISTPNLDRLCKRGYSFERTYCQGSQHGAVCAPSRTMLLTGRSLHKVYSQIAKWRILPEFLQDAGYTTFLTGKWHFNKKTCRGWDQAENVLFGGMSDHNKVPACDLEDGEWTKPQQRGFSSTIFANSAMGFLDRYAKGDRAKPFFAYVSFTAPHDPRTPPPGWRRYDPDSMPLPPNYRAMHPFNNGDMRVRDEKLGAWPRSPELVREQLAEYYGLISHLDHEVGRIVTRLQRNGLADDTIIVYAADHGLAVGSHGLLGKQNLYEHSMRAPLIIAGPGIPQGSTEHFVYLFDLFPTICSWAGAKAPDYIAGHDLAALWNGAEWPRRSMYTSYAQNIRAVRDKRFKLLRYPRVDRTQLFDLKKDPHELRNLAGLPKYAKELAHMRILLEDWQRKTGDPLGWNGGKAMRAEFAIPEQRKPDRWQPEWVRRKYFDAQPTHPWAKRVAALGEVPSPFRQRAPWPLVVEEDFADGAAALERVAMSDASKWRIAKTPDGAALELLGKSGYRPAVRSPRSIALLDGLHFGSFVLEAELEQTGREYGHRDLCLFFGYESKQRFYYVHLASKADKNAHNVFAVDSAARKNIALQTTKGIDWGQNKRHKVRLYRNTQSGEIAVWFDDMSKPIMRAVDRRFVRGQIGFGSFDDEGRVHKVRIWGKATPARCVSFAPAAKR